MCDSMMVMRGSEEGTHLSRSNLVDIPAISQWAGIHNDRRFHGGEMVIRGWDIDAIEHRVTLSTLTIFGLTLYIRMAWRVSWKKNLGKCKDTSNGIKEVRRVLKKDSEVYHQVSWLQRHRQTGSISILETSCSAFFAKCLGEREMMQTLTRRRVTRRCRMERAIRRRRKRLIGSRPRCSCRHRC